MEAAAPQVLVFPTGKLGFSYPQGLKLGHLLTKHASVLAAILEWEATGPSATPKRNLAHLTQNTSDAFLWVWLLVAHHCWMGVFQEGLPISTRPRCCTTAASPEIYDTKPTPPR
ncbi:hypothetical protein N3K66_002408 [Trichothecium roseum]|uniref:Uncharacterized protein n=1 Tax=Trichothecium roseum TaxID=47278 RepID=A0ACC0V992_9HYPO|nr:hypothetical protein N3K66_002408 [Trichothecium roseum]